MVRGLAAQRFLALVAVGCALLVGASAAAAGSSRSYTPTVVAGVFKDAGIELHVYTVTGLGPDAYTWLRPGVKCAGNDRPCVTETTKAQRLFVVVCPSAHAAARVVSATSRLWEARTIANVVVAYRTAFLQQRPRGVGVAISRLSSGHLAA